MTRGDVVGTWRLVSYEAGDTYPMGKDAVGVLHYSPEGKVSVHIMGEGYFAYYGDYTIDGATITHHLEMASEPSFVGASNVRHARLRGSTLVLTGRMGAREIKVTWRRPRARRRKSARR